ncbi:MAG: hypothetical protein QM648_01920 [Solirubrobacterales bacterium]
MTAVVVISFASFIADEAGTAKDESIATANDTAVVGAVTRRDQHGRREGIKHSKVRLKIDQVNDAVTSPGESIGQSASDNPWAIRGLAFLFGIAAFFFGLRILANWLQMSKGSNANREFVVHDVGNDDFTPTGR